MQQPTGPEASHAPDIGHRPVHNRISALMAHSTRYAFKGVTRLARDAGASKSAISRLIRGQCSPSFSLVCAVTAALERELGRSISPREVVSLDGTYPTPCVCDLAGCSGCLPEEAYDEEERLRPEFFQVLPGQWSLSRSAAGTALWGRGAR